MTRNSRHLKLLELIQKKDIETQEELAEELNKAGFSVTQATVSRDIKDLGLIKVSAGGRRQKYAKEPGAKTITAKFSDMFKSSVVTIDYAQNIVVIKTLSGGANIAGMMIDSLNSKSVLGCVAGDDTVFAVLRSIEDAESMTQRLQEIAFG